jgi:cyclopropane fatty-acyl-phospholipid synthase-like methyltransferase
MMEDNPAWYKTWFDTPFYHTLYQDRNIEEAQFFLQNLIKNLSIKQSDHILDIACGRGRHALYLAEQGFQVTGIDLSPNSILYAQQAAKKEHLNATFYVHDMREATDEKVGVILNVFTSIGYFEDAKDNTKAIRAFYDSLVDGGVAIIDFLHVPQVKKHWVADEIVTKNDITFTLKRTFVDGWIEKHISFENKGKPHAFNERVRALELPDFEQICNSVGFKIAKVFGDYALTPFNPEIAERLIIVLQK